jgi:hypothetical protein
VTACTFGQGKSQEDALRAKAGDGLPGIVVQFKELSYTKEFCGAMAAAVCMFVRFGPSPRRDSRENHETKRGLARLL